MAGRKPKTKAKAKTKAKPETGGAAGNEPVVSLQSVYTLSRALEMVTHVADGGTIRQWCRKNNYREAAVRAWVTPSVAPAAAIQDDIPRLYRESIEMQAEAWADQIIEIADDASGDYTENAQGRLRHNREAVERSKLRVQARMDLMKANAPRRWMPSNKQEVGDADAMFLRILTEMSQQQLAARVEAITAKEEAKPTKD